MYSDFEMKTIAIVWLLIEQLQMIWELLFSALLVNICTAGLKITSLSFHKKTKKDKYIII